MESTKVLIATKVSKNEKESHKTELTIQWDIDQAAVVALAQKSVVIMQQAIYRESGKIPATDTIKVSELMVKRPRTAKVVTAANVAELVTSGKISKEELLALLK